MSKEGGSMASGRSTRSSATAAAAGDAWGWYGLWQCCVLLGIKHVKYEHINLFSTHLNNGDARHGSRPSSGVITPFTIQYSLFVIRHSLFSVCRLLVAVCQEM